MKFALTFLLVSIFLLGNTFTAFSAVPQQISYQGMLTNTSGAPINTTVTMSFSLYDVASGGAALWGESQSVAVSKGIYNVRLGAVTPITLVFNKQYYLGVKVGTDIEMTPRNTLSSVAYSIVADTANSLNLSCQDGQYYKYSSSGGWGCGSNMAGAGQIVIYGSVTPKVNCLIGGSWDNCWAKEYGQGFSIVKISSASYDIVFDSPLPDTNYVFMSSDPSCIGSKSPGAYSVTSTCSVRSFMIIR